MVAGVQEADVHTASDEYAARFGGAVGRWMLDVQTRIVLNLLHGRESARILDVGGGHGQLAFPLVQHGFDVTVLGSCEDALLQTARAAAHDRLHLQVGSVVPLTCPDKSFDIVLCFRLLTHCEAWKQLVSELCRVARETVIVDYPTGQSLNTLTPLLFSFKKNVEKNTRPYTLFRHSEIEDEFRRAKFHVRRREKQFFMPMVVHRMLKNPALSQAMERVPRLCRLTSLLGSPVILSCSRMGA